MTEGRKYRCWAEIDLSALERNLGRIRSGMPEGVRYVSVIKADAYGHGFQAMATRLMQVGVDLFAVANVEEGRQLRELGTGWPILVLSPILLEESFRVFEDSLIPTLSSEEEVVRFNALAEEHKIRLPVHLKIDTGMSRVGVWYEEADPLFEAIDRASHLELAGIYTHFSCAVSDPEFTETQRRRFLDILETRSLNPDQFLIHADNSAGLESFRAGSPFNAVRVGLLQCGILPYPDSVLAKVRVEPVFRFYTRVGLVKNIPAGVGISYNHWHTTEKPTRIAVLTAGYGDGIPIGLSNRGEVLIRGRRCPVRGRICMDQTIVDVTHLPTIEVGDSVTLVGTQADEKISLAEFARQAETIPYEILTSVTKRVTRVYTTSREV